MHKRLLVLILIYISYVLCWQEEKCTEQTKADLKIEDCTIVYPINSKLDYRCCYVYYKKGETEIKNCMVYPYDYKKLEIIKTTTYQNMKDVDIQCSGNYLFISAIFIIAIVF